MNTELGAFLRSRRGEVVPEDVGLASGPRRRVRGLRREEVAELAGISVEYLVRLEQGRAARPSEAVVESLARALSLSDTERGHLIDLARLPRRDPAPPRKVRPELARLLDLMDGVPAMITDHRLDLLAWNRLAAALFAGFGDGERNLARYVFLDEISLYPDMSEIQRGMVGQLRLATGRHPGDTALMALIGELSVRSERFRTYWAGRVVKERTHGVKRFTHPVVGELRLHFETFELPGASGQRLNTFHPEAGSASEESLRLLASWSVS
ncbi:helix-turn-helix transcriptional regulator [Nonomuraea rhizosphaerae]|uniref:helix-turn-helix transcriptional regulator n=1 Tax=Nonomuraea rhizosphaerae TaxID=2665663 RepID=UPI001C5D1053|nr:helix-turn-helix transcriptional regulator [Nonomuraea rhizosphaerae]